jgi:hypothetical protein
MLSLARTKRKLVEVVVTDLPVSPALRKEEGFGMSVRVKGVFLGKIFSTFGDKTSLLPRLFSWAFSFSFSHYEFLARCLLDNASIVATKAL